MILRVLDALQLMCPISQRKFRCEAYGCPLWVWVDSESVTTFAPGELYQQPVTSQIPMLERRGHCGLTHETLGVR
jgi:hypothetical protein